MSDESRPGPARDASPIAHRSSSEPSGRRPRPAVRALLRRRGVVTALLTAMLAAVFALGIALGRVTVRGGRGGQRVMPIVDVWRAFLDNLPAQAPGVLSRVVLLVLLALAVVAAAYVLVATLRLPPEETEGADDAAGTDGARTPEA
jgi:hypothetical protein